MINIDNVPPEEILKKAVVTGPTRKEHGELASSVQYKQHENLPTRTCACASPRSTTVADRASCSFLSRTASLFTLVANFFNFFDFYPPSTVEVGDIEELGD